MSAIDAAPVGVSILFVCSIFVVSNEVVKSRLFSYIMKIIIINFSKKKILNYFSYHISKRA